MCDRCGASDAVYFYRGVCRRCIHLKAEVLDHDEGMGCSDLELDFALTPYQKEISEKLCSAVLEGKSVFLSAVCGAGKTEMCLELISKLIKKGSRIGWAIPRREVVIELGMRLQNYFPGLKVVSVYGGQTEEVWGDLIICTTHQLYRYEAYFDVLILDEPDAFPYEGNAMLKHIMHRSVLGPIVYLSATLEDEGLDIVQLNLDLRVSQHLLPEPKVTFSFFTLVKTLWEWRNEKVLVFVPTRKLARIGSLLLRCQYLTSQSPDREKILDTFRKRGGFLVCTTVLERGVTFIDCFVIVLFADHIVFTKSSLVQIAGRVGRGMNPKCGSVLFISRYFSEEVQGACLKISQHNHDAQSVLKQYSAVSGSPCV